MTFFKNNKFKEFEVDFVAETGRDRFYYQVAQSVLNEQTLDRELKSLNKINDHNPKFLLTMDMVPDVSYNGIKQINIIDWLLN